MATFGGEKEIKQLYTVQSGIDMLWNILSDGKKKVVGRMRAPESGDGFNSSRISHRSRLV